MAPEANKSRAKSKKTGKTAKRKKNAPKLKEDKKDEKIPTIPRLDGARPGGIGLDKMPSNAPTMAIAPSDYEHIFHEGPGGGGGGGPAGGGGPNAAESANASRSPQGPPLAVSPPQQAPPVPKLQAAQQQYGQDYSQQQAQVDALQVTPDGYTMLGQPGIEVNASGGASRRIALPPHVVRASNQFSRAVLARVARYLASRAESY